MYHDEFRSVILPSPTRAAEVKEKSYEVLISVCGLIGKVDDVSTGSRQRGWPGVRWKTHTRLAIVGGGTSKGKEVPKSNIRIPRNQRIVAFVGSLDPLGVGGGNTVVLSRPIAVPKTVDCCNSQLVLLINSG